MKFVDTAMIRLKAGDGGAGCVSFRREKHVNKGGPDGGDGGRGGNIILRTNRHLNTLLDFHYNKSYKSPRGEHGMGSRKTGKSGSDLVLEVPVGTIVRDAATEELIADLVNEHDEVVAVDGGTGGRGNAAFASATNQAPREYEVGTPGEEREVLLELKLLADVGLVGFPNAGKSTLIAAISAAKPKIADYPFTTLVPNLGIVQVDLGKSFVVADIPGLIEGAHAGKGLGIQFLRHIERTRFLVFLLDANADNPKGDYRVLLNELKLFDPTLLKKSRLIALTKIDAVDETVRRSLAKTKFPGADAFLISAVARTNLRDLVGRMWKEVTSKKGETLSITSSKKTRRRKKTKVTPLRRRWD